MEIYGLVPIFKNKTGLTSINFHSKKIEKEEQINLKQTKGGKQYRQWQKSIKQKTENKIKCQVIEKINKTGKPLIRQITEKIEGHKMSIPEIKERHRNRLYRYKKGKQGIITNKFMTINGQMNKLGKQSKWTNSQKTQITKVTKNKLMQ